jgi:hypothetical protein
MRHTLAVFGQVVVYLLFAAFVGMFADSPAYTYFPPDRAQIKLSFSHGAQRRGECRRRSAEEIAKLAPNMRRADDCPRGRQPIHVELTLDGTLLYSADHAPTGLSGDGPARIYRRFTTTPGPHKLVVAMRDGAGTEGFGFQREAEIVLKPRQNLVVDFRAESGGFIFR